MISEQTSNSKNKKLCTAKNYWINGCSQKEHETIEPIVIVSSNGKHEYIWLVNGKPVSLNWLETTNLSQTNTQWHAKRVVEINRICYAFLQRAICALQIDVELRLNSAQTLEGHLPRYEKVVQVNAADAL